MQLNNSHPNQSALDWLADACARNESIVGKIIRERRERETETLAAKAARARRVRIACLILWPVACYLAIVATTWAMDSYAIHSHRKAMREQLDLRYSLEEPFNVPL